MESQKKQNGAAEKFGVFIALVIMTGIIIGLVRGGYWLFEIISPFEGYSNKEEISTVITKAISNGADLESIQILFENREVSDSFITRIYLKPDNVYEEPIKLEDVLGDIKSQLFMNKPDDSTLQKINLIIEEHRKSDPFAILQDLQRERFNNVRTKLGEQYPLVEADVVKISEELAKQNTLVKEYLATSTASFWISIFGLFFSISISAYQLYKSNKQVVSNGGLMIHLFDKLENNISKMLGKI